MGIFNTFNRWFGRGGALGETKGTQNASPSVALVSGTTDVGVDGAMQLSTVWACVDRRATAVASLPFFAYEQKNGEKTLARNSRLYGVLHKSPNPRMTPFNFWRAMMMNHDLRGNAYARIDRAPDGEAVALWPMPSDQVEMRILDDGAVVYVYQFGSDVAVLAEANVLHLKNLGNGTIGLAKLDFMRASTNEAAQAQAAATKLFGSGGKPTGVLMVDGVLKPDQREALRKSFSGLAEGNTSRLMVLEASMKYQQLSITPEDQQLLETRHFGVEEICRWFDVPPVLAHHNGVTTWGSGVEQIIDGWYKLSLRPMLVNIEQSTTQRVLTAKQRANMECEFSMDAMLRGTPDQRADMYAKGAQNGWLTRAEIRQLEGWPFIPGTNVLTAQSNLVPLDKLGQTIASGGSGADIAQ